MPTTDSPGLRQIPRTGTGQDPPGRRDRPGASGPVVSRLGSAASSAAATLRGQRPGWWASSTAHPRRRSRTGTISRTIGGGRPRATWETASSPGSRRAWPLAAWSSRWAPIVWSWSRNWSPRLRALSGHDVVFGQFRTAAITWSASPELACAIPFSALVESVHPGRSSPPLPREEGWSVALLPMRHDIDTWEDWQAYLVRTGKSQGEADDAGGGHSDPE